MTYLYSIKPRVVSHNYNSQHIVGDIAGDDGYGDIAGDEGGGDGFVLG